MSLTTFIQLMFAVIAALVILSIIFDKLGLETAMNRTSVAAVFVALGLAVGVVGHLAMR